MKYKIIRSKKDWNSITDANSLKINKQKWSNKCSKIQSSYFCFDSNISYEFVNEVN